MKRLSWGGRGQLKVRTFGQAEVLLQGQPVQWRSDTSRQLFFYFLTHPVGKSREHIIESLWNHLPDANSNNRFRVTVHRIRLALGWPGAVVEEYGRYHLAQEVQEASDLHSFYTLLAQARQQPRSQGRVKKYQQALLLYQGQYLPLEAGDWVGDVRAQLQASYVQIQMEMALLLCGQGDCLASVKAQAEALRTDPYLGEEHHQSLMGCLWATQGKYAATEYYRRFAHLSRQEVDDTPMSETVELAQHIKEDERPCQRCWELWPLEGGSPRCPLSGSTRLRLVHL